MNNLTERVSPDQLSQVEAYADKLFAKVGIDVEFTRHFKDRLNDLRNKKPITSAELVRIFRETYKMYGKKIPALGPDAQAVIADMKTDINIPFVLNVSRDGGLDLINKTVMRKKDYKTSNTVLELPEAKEENFLKRFLEEETSNRNPLFDFGKHSIFSEKE
ncbi:MAG: hypothetical protein LC687_00230 [Actinobacteria bacterium]|nr:hypothetical protein [Actinomycetota bacterium]MCA1806297.1 hypothetical protein [Actinomycetota bacterium]